MRRRNSNALWGQVFADELAASGVDRVAISPGSRSTPLTFAFAENSDIEVFSHLDERSSAFFALGQGKASGEPSAVVSTSGTAAANFYPAIIEADRARVPLIVLTADRPPELRDTGANQTIDQEKLYGDRVRWYADVAEPGAEPRRIRSLRVMAARAVSESLNPPKGPVHLNFPFRKPLEPAEGTTGGVDGVEGRDEAFVRFRRGDPELSSGELGRVVEKIEGSGRGFIVAGPRHAGTYNDGVIKLAEATGYPVLADALSGTRFGGHLDHVEVLGGYDSYLCEEVTGEWPDPEVVIRLGAAPVSDTLENYLRRTAATQLLVDRAGGWRKASFTPTDVVLSCPERFAKGVSEGLDVLPVDPEWREGLSRTEERYWEIVEGHDEFFEGMVLHGATSIQGSGALFVSNSMPVRDMDRFGKPSREPLRVFGNRGASGIDGIVSTGLGVGSCVDEPLLLVLGDLAYYHDMNGLLSLERHGIDATVVLINNDGGGIFHMLPISKFDPPFTEHFKTPHGLDFEPTCELYGLDYERVEGGTDGFKKSLEGALARGGSSLLEVKTDAEESHQLRTSLEEEVRNRLGGNSLQGMQ